MSQFAKNYNAEGETFIRYDYGTEGNLKHYGREKPPPYDLSLVTAPVYLFWGENDLLTTPTVSLPFLAEYLTIFDCLLFFPFPTIGFLKDVAWLASKLPNLKASIRVDYPYFNHWDFLWSTNVNELLYDRIIPLLPDPYLL